MDILYIKRSYEILNKDRCGEYRKIQIGKNKQIRELVFSAKYIDEIISLKNKYIELNRKVNKQKRDKKYISFISLNIKKYINKKILDFKMKLLSCWIKRAYYKRNIENPKYILSSEILKNESIKLIITDSLQSKKNRLQEYIYLGQYDKNILKYVEQYRENKKISKNNIKIAMVYCKNSKIDKNMLNILLEEYKVVDILEISKNISSYKPNIDILDKINQQTGASVGIVDINSKKVKEYNYIIIMDANSLNEYIKGFNRKANKISILDTNADILNTNIESVDLMVKEGNLIQDTIKRLRQDYGLVTFSKSLVYIYEDINNI